MSANDDDGSRDGATVRTTVSDAVPDAERCRLPAPALEATGLEVGQQLRLRYDGDPAVFTVDDAAGPEAVVNDGGRSRLGATGDSFSVEPATTVVDGAIDRTTAATDGGYVDRLTDPGGAGLAALAPHGGFIEWGTDYQAHHVGDRLDATAWYAAGWWPSGGAFPRWHVTSTDLHRASYPGLDAIADRGFDHAVSFHGWTESHVAVGGAAPRDLRADVRDAIAAAVDGIEVRFAGDDPRCGEDPTNVVNRITAGRPADPRAGGVQLEQSLAAREEFGAAIADAVADVFAERMTGAGADRAGRRPD